PARSSVWLFRKAYNVGFYLLMVSWYSFPYSIVQIYRFFTRQVSAAYMGDLVLTKKQFQEWRIIVISFLLCAGIYILGLSLSDRLAQRYIYPVYWIVGFAAAASLLMSSKRLRDLSDTWIGENSLSLLWICWGSFKVVAIVFKWL